VPQIEEAESIRESRHVTRAPEVGPCYGASRRPQSLTTSVSEPDFAGILFSRRGC
jgi:hypothetical protein